MEKDKDLNSGQVIARAAVVLRALEGQAAGLTIAELARATGLPRTTVLRTVTALQAQQFVAAIESRFRLGPAIMQLAGSTYLDVVAVARPHLETLARATHETTNLSVMRGAHAVLVDQVTSDHELRVVSPVGSALLLHCTAHGKALLATMDDAEVCRRMGGALTRRTARTLCALAELQAELATVRATRIAHDRGENLDGVCGLGIALRTGTPERYALSLVMPETRYADGHAAATDLLRATAAAIDSVFG